MRPSPFRDSRAATLLSTAPSRLRRSQARPSPTRIRPRTAPRPRTERSTRLERKRRPAPRSLRCIPITRDILLLRSLRLGRPRQLRRLGRARLLRRPALRPDRLDLDLLHGSWLRSRLGGSCGGTINGSIAATQVCYGASSNTCAGTSNFIYTATSGANGVKLTSTDTNAILNHGNILTLCNSSATYCAYLEKQADGSLILRNDNQTIPGYGYLGWDAYGDIASSRAAPDLRSTCARRFGGLRFPCLRLPRF